MSAETDKQWQKFLDPDDFRQRMIQAAVFVTSYETLKQQCLVEQVKKRCQAFSTHTDGVLI